MNKLDYLIQYLLKETGKANLRYKEEEKKKLYRKLVNIRKAKPISEEFLNVEDEYLQEELKKKKITDVACIKTVAEQYEISNLANSDKICFWKGNITELKVDAVVNAANSMGLGCFRPNHNCIDNQIHTNAGVRLRLSCNKIMKVIDYNIGTGNAILTSGYNLPCKYIIHTVGPVVSTYVSKQKEEELYNCYMKSLELAVENGARTVAFPCISTGVFNFPKDLASAIALFAVDKFISHNREKIDKVVFALWKDEDVEIYEKKLEII